MGLYSTTLPFPSLTCLESCIYLIHERLSWVKIAFSLAALHSLRLSFWVFNNYHVIQLPTKILCSLLITKHFFPLCVLVGVFIYSCGDMFSGFLYLIRGSMGEISIYSFPLWP